MTPREILIRTRAVLRERGWCQFKLTDNGHVCLLGAINIVLGDSFANHQGIVYVSDEHRLLHTRLSVLLGFDSTNDLVHWNDGTFREQTDVIDRLDRTIAGIPAAHPHGPGEALSRPRSHPHVLTGGRTRSRRIRALLTR